MAFHRRTTVTRAARRRDVAAGLLLIAMLAAPSRAPAQQGLCGEWEVVSTPLPPTGDLGGSEFRDVVAIAPDDVWAVGETRTGSPDWDTKTLAMHWDGTGWTIVPTPNPSWRINSLEAVAAVSSDDVWAAGLKEVYTPFGELRPLILHWDGTAWEEVVDSALEYTFAVLWTIEVVGPDDVWFGGDRGTTFHWDGSGIEVRTVPTFDTGSCSGTAGCGHAVVDMAAVAPDDIWAVGGGGDGDYSFVSQIWHWDGVDWTHVPGPSIPYWQRLYGVTALASDDVWAVGDLDAADPSDNGMLILHWDGSQWSRVATPLFTQPSGSLFDVVAIGPDDIWAAGIYTEVPLPAEGLPLTLHYDGNEWIQVMPDPFHPEGAWLRGVTASAACDLWSVGESYRLGVNGDVPHVQRFHPLAPTIRLASFEGADECPGGGPGHANGVWEPGESIQMPVTVAAFSGGFTNVVGDLTSASPGVTILDGTATWPDIPVGESATSNAPHFTIALDGGVACGTMLGFEVSVGTAEGGPFLLEFLQQVGDPVVLSGPGASIPDNDPLGVTSALAVAENVTLTDLNIRVAVSHSWVGDVKIELESPAGTRITLLDRPGVPATGLGCGDNDMDVTFDDTSVYDLETHCAGTTPWYDGAAAPTQSLSAFHGEGTGGTWKLIVSDHFISDSGSLVSWDFLPTPSVGGTCNDCEGVTEAAVVAAADRFGLAPARPNPFGASTEMMFTLDRAAKARLDVFDVTGRRVRTVVDSELPAGRHAFVWNGTDAQGSTVAAGLYFVRLTSAGRTEMGRVVRLR